MKQSTTYGMGIFETGDFLIPEEDRRRFVTLDYHLDTYVGILGNGIITGWDVQIVAGRMVRVVPGSGFIVGLYSESPYATDPATSEPLRKSVAKGLGYVVTESIPGWSSRSGSWEGSFFNDGGSPDEDALVFKQLGPDGEDKNYDGIIDGVLEPQYTTPPESHFSDPYVKSYAPATNQFLLDDNSDTYIFAERLSMDPPSTFVKFVATKSYFLTASRVLLAKVVTRDGTISKIDTSMSFRLSGMSGNIAEIGRELVRTHIHGGSAKTDPPRISLKTDIRSCVPSNKVNGAVTYTIIPSKTTGVTASHRHAFHADSNGDGYTTSVVGTYEFHYHRIESWEITETRGNYGSSQVVDHSHSVPQEDSTLSQDSNFKVYVNGSEANPSDYVVNAASRTVTFAPGKVNLTYPLYYSSFQIRGTTETGPKRTYEFQMETPSIKRFIVGMMLDFYDKYRTEIEGVGVETTTTTLKMWDASINDYVDIDVEQSNLVEGGYYLRSPFDFYVLRDGGNVEMDEQGNLHAQDYVPITEPLTGPIVSGESGQSGTTESGNRVNIIEAAEVDYRGIEDVDPMAIMAATVLKKEGDEFTILPNAAKFIPMDLKRAGHADEVVVEILDDVEVSGILKQENIYFVRAKKFISGEFLPARIPFLNHVGRMGEALRPQTSGTTTKDGVEFVPSAYRTAVSMGHSHRSYVDASGNGVTLATMINDKLAVWAYDKDGKAVRITHGHLISGGKTDSDISAGINAWAGVESGTSHWHTADEVVHGMAKSVFSLAEDDDGNILMGTSDGAWVVPAGRALLTTVGDRSYYSYGTDVEETLKRAASRYANETGEAVNLDSSILSQSATAEAALSSVGDSYSFGGNPAMSMTVETYAKVDNLYEESTKPEDQINPDEVKVRNVSHKTVDDTINLALGSDTETEDYYLVRRDLGDRSMWGLVANGAVSSIVSHKGISTGALSSSWRDAVIPSGAGIVRAAAVSSPTALASSSSSSSSSSADMGESTPTWVAAASRSCLVSRNGGTSYSEAPGLVGKDCFDVVFVGGNWFLLSTSEGVYRVNSDGSFSKTLNKTDCRWLAIDWGPEQPVAYCVGVDGTISQSLDGGLTWTDEQPMPSTMGETGRLFPAFGRLLAATPSGAVDIVTGAVVLNEHIRCMAWSKNLKTAYFGGDGCVYRTQDCQLFEKIASFDGVPFPVFYIDGETKHFGYAHNYDGGVCFVSPPSTTSKVTAATSFDRWIADGGGWDQAVKAEIFIDGVKVLSGKTGIDVRGTSCDNFSVDALSGAIDFTTSSTLSSNVLRGEKTLYLSDALSFSSQRSLVLSDVQGREYILALSAVSGVVQLAAGLERDMALGSKVRILSSMTGDSEVSGNFFESDLEGVGTMSHQEVEDALSDATTGLPMRVSETYLGNLSAIAVAAKRAIDDVDAKMVNWKAYRMEYGCDPEGEDYVGNDFDIEATTAGSKSVFSRDSGQAMSATIRCLAFGDGEYSGLVFAGSDAGLFYCTISDGMERPWLQAKACPVEDVFGIVIVHGNSLVVAGSGGVFVSERGGFDSWTQVASLSTSSSKATMLSFRWSGSVGTRWWNSWDGSTNTMSPDVTNAIVVGGAEFLMVSQDNGQTWSSVPMDIAGAGYEASCMLPVSDGTALLATNGGSQGKTSILNDFGSGDTWEESATFPGVSGKVTSCSEDDAGNITVWLQHDGSEPNLKDHALAGLVAVVGNKRRVVADNRDGAFFLQGIEAVPVGTRLSIPPLAINAMAETDGSQILVGTSLGILTDNGTYQSVNKGKGVINRLDKSATVDAIDIGGSVAAAGVQSGESTSLVCTLDRSVRTNDLTGKKLVFTTSTSPSVAILSPTPGSTVASSDVTVITSTSMFEPGKSGKIKVVLDAREPVYSSSNTTVLSGVPAGHHSLVVTLISTAGADYTNPEATKKVSFYTSASATSPSISVTFPSQGQIIGSSSVDITGQVLNFNAAGVDGTLTYALDAASSLEVVMRQDGWFSIPLSNLANGSHSVRLSLIGATSGQVVTYVDAPFIIDLTSDPYIRATYPSSGATLAVNYIEVKYAVSNFVIPDQGLVKVVVDGTSQLTSSSATSVVLANLSNGPHTVVLTLVDQSLVPVSTSYGSAILSLTVSASTASSPRVVVLSPTNGTVFASGTTFVDINYDTANYVIPDDGGVVVKSGSSETFVTAPATYRLPVSNGSQSVTLTLARSVIDKLVNTEATSTVSFIVGSVTSRTIAPPATLETVPIATPRVVQPSTRAVTDDENSSSSEEDLEGFTVLSNGASAANGETVIVVASKMGTEANGMPFRVVGDLSTVYFSPAYPIVAGEFAGGTMYIDTTERNNASKSYGIISNTTATVTLTSAISPRRAEGDTSTPDLYVGQSVRFLKANGKGDAWVTFDRDWEKNALSGEAIAVDHANGGRSYGVVVSNTSRTMEVYGIDRTAFSPGDTMIVMTPVFSDVASFSAVKTTTDVDHYHSTSLLVEWVRGKIASATLLSSSKVWIAASEASGLDDPLIAADPEIMQGAKIVFYSFDGGMAFEESIDLVYPTGIIVNVSDPSHWNLDGSMSFGIDSTYRWESDARRCGKTVNTTYVDFITYTTRTDRDVAAGSTTVWVPSPESFIVGDTVEIYDSSGTVQRTSVVSVGTSVRLADPVEKTFAIAWGASIRIRRDVFGVAHEHLVRNGEVHSASIEEYQDIGYPLTHNHVLSSLIRNVTCLKSDGHGSVYVGGSSEFVMASCDEGGTWKEATSLSTEGSDPCGMSSCMATSSAGILAVGTGCGFVVLQATTISRDAIPLAVDVVEQSSSSSSLTTTSFSSASSRSSSSESSDSSSSSL